MQKTENNLIRVLIVEDSPVMQQMLIYTISSDPSMKIVGVAHNGEEAILAVNKLNPDVIAMDFNMPKLNGIEATRAIMSSKPTPIVIVTGSITAKDQALSFKIIEAGALAVIKKPPGFEHPDFKNEAKTLIQTLKLMSEVKLVRRFSNHSKGINISEPKNEKPNIEDNKIRLVAMGASTGGPNVLQSILYHLPKDLPVAILIVQHISQGFTAGFAEWLKKTTGFPIHIPNNGDFVFPGHVYIAPDNVHMGVDQRFRIKLSPHPAENGLRPSVSYLFRTVAENIESRAVGIILTGMGRDGAEELKLIRDRGGITIAQNEETSVVHGMPGVAIKLGAAMHVLSPDEISSTIKSLIEKTNTPKLS